MQMFRLLPIVCLFAMWVMPLGAISPMSPDKAWARFQLKKDLTLENGVDIYNTFVEHYRSPDMVEFGSPENQALYDLSLAWATHHEADKREFTLTLPKGTSVLECLRKIAEKRQERFTSTSNHCVMVPSAHPPIQLSYMQKGEAPSADLSDRFRHCFISCSIILREPDNDDLENFLTYRFQRSWELNNKSACPYRVVASKAAREKLPALNLVGYWTYEEVLDTASYICGLQWQINGTTIRIDRATALDR